MKPAKRPLAEIRTPDRGDRPEIVMIPSCKCARPSCGRTLTSSDALAVGYGRVCYEHQFGRGDYARLEKQGQMRMELS
jgi:hypothetical protein